MNVLLIFSHPNPMSFNHSILEVFAEELRSRHHHTLVRDLYTLDFKAVLDRDDLGALHAGQVPGDIQKEQEYLSWAEALVFIYPVWWWERPAMLKGYIDRVFSYGFAFSVDEKGAVGLLKHRKALVIQTLGTPEHVYDKSPGSKEAIRRNMTEGTLQFCGITDTQHLSIFGINTSTAEERARILDQVGAIAREF